MVGMAGLAPAISSHLTAVALPGTRGSSPRVTIDERTRRLCALAVKLFPLRRLHALPGGFQLVERFALERRGGRFHRAETVLELARGAAQRLFRVDAQVAREIDHREQQIAELVLDARLFGLALDLVAQLVELLVDLGEHRRRVLPVEADARGALLQFLGSS